MRFFSSAPGKVILFGEHVVMYNSTAIAVTLSSLRVHASLTTNEQDAINIYFSNLLSVDLLPISIKLTEIHSAFKHLQGSFLSASVDKPTDDIKEELIMFCNKYSKINSVIRSLSSLIYLIISIFPFILEQPRLLNKYREKDNLGFDITIRSNELPISAGLGSSSAFSVCVTTALLQYYYYNIYNNKCPECKNDLIFNNNVNNNNNNNDIIPCKHFQNTINNYSFKSECIFHGNNLSGIDNTISTFGGACAYSKIHPKKSYHNFPILRLLIINTNIDHCTLDMVNIVKEKLKNEEYKKSILKEMDDLMNDCVKQIELFIKNPKDNDRIDSLNKNIEKNQRYLEDLGVSHLKINKACEILNKYDLKGKITGAGGGGCIYCIIKDEDKEKSRLISNDLKEEKMSCFLAEVGGNGVLLHKNVSITPSPCSLL